MQGIGRQVEMWPAGRSGAEIGRTLRVAGQEIALEIKANLVGAKPGEMALDAWWWD